MLGLTFKKSALAFFAVALLLFSSRAEALLSEACVVTSQPNISGCPPQSPPFDMQPEASCVQATQKAMTDCQDAQKKCQAQAQIENGHIAEGEAASGAAGLGSNGMQQNTESSNGLNMCSGQDTNTKRAADGEPIKSAMQKCQSSAQSCSMNGTCSSPANQAQQGLQKATSEIAARTADAAQMAQKCGQSAENASKLGEMAQQLGQMMSGMGKGGSSNSGVTSTPEAPAPFVPTTSSLDGSVASNGVTISSPTVGDGTSSDSGSTPSSAGGGASSDPNSFGSSQISAAKPGLGDITAGESYRPPEGSMGSNSSGANAAADGAKAVAADSSGASKAGGDDHEMKMSGGAALLGIKANKPLNDDDIDAMLGGSGKNAKGEMPAGGVNKLARVPAMIKGGSVEASSNQDSSGGSLFQMVRSRYLALHQNGHI